MLIDMIASTLPEDIVSMVPHIFASMKSETFASMIRYIIIISMLRYIIASIPIRQWMSLP